ncbi:hypothetical protein ACWEGC_11535, partial [Nocardia grenadensis]
DRQRPETSSESRAATSQKLHKTPAQRLKLKLGDPLAEFGHNAHLPSDIAGGLGAFSAEELTVLGIPSEDEYVAKYCERSVRQHIDDLDLYLAFNAFRLYAIMHGIRARIAHGTAASPHADEMISSMPQLAQLGRRLAERAGD